MLLSPLLRAAVRLRAFSPSGWEEHGVLPILHEHWEGFRAHTSSPSSGSLSPLGPLLAGGPVLQIRLLTLVTLLSSAWAPPPLTAHWKVPPGRNWHWGLPSFLLVLSWVPVLHQRLKPAVSRMLFGFLLTRSACCALGSFSKLKLSSPVTYLSSAHTILSF